MFQGSRFSVLSHVEGWINTPRYPQLRGSPWLASLKSTPSLPGSSVVTHPAVLLQLPYFRALPAWDHSWVISEEGCVCVDMAGGTAQVHNDYKVTLIISTLFPFFFFNPFLLFLLLGPIPCSPKCGDPSLKETQVTPHDRETAPWKMCCTCKTFCRRRGIPQMVATRFRMFLCHCCLVSNGWWWLEISFISYVCSVLLKSYM